MRMTGNQNRRRSMSLLTQLKQRLMKIANGSDPALYVYEADKREDVDINGIYKGGPE
jgi:hypothetical protein